MDLIINSSNKIQEQYKNIIKRLELIEDTQIKHKKIIERLEKNFDFIKEQENEVITTLKNSKDISINNLYHQLQQLDNKTEEVKEIAIRIEEITRS